MVSSMFCYVYVLFVFSFFFFFKQKTAYEMRISDWSSDVCSSDLLRRQAQHPDLAVAQRGARHQPPVAARRGIEEDERRVIDRARGARTQAEIDSERSEEHTSEFQSLMRISYAVFCLKKKQKTDTSHA